MPMVVGVLGAMALIAAIFVYLAFATFNRLMALEQRCDTAFSDIDVHLKHRQNLIPGLVETVRGFASHENQILMGLSEARAKALSAVSPDARLAAEKDLTQNIVALIGIAEKYPDLKASDHFKGLRDELVQSENRITASRRFYNLAVGEYDATLRQFPGNLVARYRRLDPRKPFDLGVERILIDEPLAIKF